MNEAEIEVAHSSDSDENEEGKMGENSAENSKYIPTKKLKLIKRRAVKQYLLFFPPPVLVFHLKRFRQTGGGLQKIDSDVSFPFQMDIATFMDEEGRGKEYKKFFSFHFFFIFSCV